MFHYETDDSLELRVEVEGALQLQQITSSSSDGNAVDVHGMSTDRWASLAGPHSTMLQAAHHSVINK